MKKIEDLQSLQFYNESFKLIYVYGKMKKGKMDKDFIVLKILSERRTN